MSSGAAWQEQLFEELREFPQIVGIHAMSS
jgi:hypothetical protein